MPRDLTRRQRDGSLGLDGYCRCRARKAPVLSNDSAEQYRHLTRCHRGIYLRLRVPSPLSRRDFEQRDELAAAMPPFDASGDMPLMQIQRRENGTGAEPFVFMI